MADVKIAVKRGQLTDEIATPTDFTESGFGTVKAAIVIVGNSSSATETTPNSALSIGFWDGTNQRCIYSGATFGVTTTDSNRGTSSTNIAAIRIDTNYAKYSISNITDGVRLTMTLDNTTEQRYATVIMFGGADVTASVGNFDPASTDETRASFANTYLPSIIFYLTGGLASATESNNYIMAFGAAQLNNGIKNAVIGASSIDGQGSSNANVVTANNRCGGQKHGEGWSWTIETVGYSASEFATYTRSGTGGDRCEYLKLQFPAGYNVHLHDLTTKATTGLDSVTGLGFQPTHLLACFVNCTTINTNSSFFNVSIGASDGTTESSVTNSETDAVGTTDPSSASVAKLLRINSSVSSGGVIEANVDSFDPDGYTLNYTLAHTTVRHGFVVAFSENKNERVISTANGFLGLTGG